MIGPETVPASGAARSAHVRSTRERAMKVVAAFLMAAAFAMTGAPTASAAPAFTDNQTLSSFDPPPPCRLDNPGVCPPVAARNGQTAINQTQDHDDAEETVPGEADRNAY